MKTTLSEAVFRLRNTKFPRFPNNDAFSDWVADLAEADGYFAGLALRDEDGIAIRRESVVSHFHNLQTAFKRLPQEELEGEDQLIYKDCLEYLHRLDDVVQGLAD